MLISPEEIQNMVVEEEKRLGVHSEGFLSRHQEIMELIEQARGMGCTAEYDG